MKKIIITGLVFAFILMAVAHSMAIEKISPDPKGVELVNKLLSALSISDGDERMKAVVPLVHKSMLTGDGRELDRNTRDFSYKKACSNVKFYEQPARVTQVHKGNTYTIGFAETAEKGRSDKYFIAKKPGVAGMPAPVIIFWPENGGEPKVVNMGSL